MHVQRPGACCPAALVTVAVVMAAAGGCGGGGQARPTPQPGEPDPPAASWFRDVTDEAGVTAVYRNGEEADRYAILESLGGGVAVLDFDGDGRLDLFFPGGGRFDGPDQKQLRGLPPKLYRNLGGWKFQDVTAAGLDRLADGREWFYTHGAAVGDYDRDGWPDLLVTGYGRVALFHNEPDGAGGRRFREVTAAAGLLGPDFWSTSAAWGDLDGDGYPDLYLCQYVDWSNDNDPACPGYYPGIPRDVCPPAKFASRPHALYRNRGDGTFEDVTAAAGLRTDRADRDYGKGLGVLLVDVDRDGRADIYVANDTTDNFLYLNRSTPGKPLFEERGAESGVARDGNGMPNGSMGVDAAEFDGTGRPALWVTNYENEFHALYRNLGGAGGRLHFTFATPAAGLAEVGRAFVGFGTAFVDVDSDGWEDLVVSNGHVMRHSTKNNIAQRPLLFRNVPRGNSRGFVDARGLAGGYFGADHRGRGLAVADLDNDGRPDLVFTHLNQPARVLRNVAPAAHWLGVELAGRDRRDVVGARVTLAVGGMTRTRFLTAGRSYLSGLDPRRLFGLGTAASVGRLTVYWPSGEPRVEHWDGLPIDRYHRLEQGQGKAE
jgi:hypothetical protein